MLWLSQIPAQNPEPFELLCSQFQISSLRSAQNPDHMSWFLVKIQKFWLRGAEQHAVN
jgi:hypothetical protein